MNQSSVLLVNLGSPDSPSVPDVRRYLREFLMDGRVLDAPWPVRFFVVNCCILPSRPKHSAEAYRKIWTKEGSPLVAMGRKVQRLLQDRIDVPVELAMRYQNPSIANAVLELHHQKVRDLLVIPMFPHYAMSSFETAVERVKEVAGRLAPEMNVRIAPPYYDDRRYIAALVSSAAEELERPFDHLLFSFHGLPERHLRKSDPTCSHCLKVENCCETLSIAHRTCYRAQCLATVQAFLRKSWVPSHSVAFQSRLGKDPWLTPHTEDELRRLASIGIKRLCVICPAFVADCLETLEEIGMRGREIFLSAGGREYRLIPCLNDHPLWIEALHAMVVRRDVEPQVVEARVGDDKRPVHAMQAIR
jgi:protoporphyrin/coproporphyrin ferrochelatase